MLSSQTFDAYGYRQSTDGDSDPYAGFGGQSGYYTDWETGTAASSLELLGLRYYDPAAGRFLTRDPASYGGGVNLYEYAGDNPTGANDPLGLDEGSGGGSSGVVGIGQGLLAGIASCMGNIVGQRDNPDPSECKSVSDCITGMVSGLVHYYFEQIGRIPGQGVNAFLYDELFDAAEGLVACIADAICDHTECSPPPNWGCLAMKCLYSMGESMLGGLASAACGIIPIIELKALCQGAIEVSIGRLTGAGDLPEPKCQV